MWKPILHGEVQKAIMDATARYKGGHLGATTSSPLTHYAQVICFQPLGILGGLSSLFGLIYLIKTKHYPIVVFFLSLTATFFLANSQYVVFFPRNITILSPIPFILAGAGLTFWLKNIPRNSNGDLSHTVMVTLFMAAIGLLAEPIVRFGIQLQNDYQVDSRKVASEWIEKNIKADSKIGFIHPAWGAPYTSRTDLNKIEIPSAAWSEQKFAEVDYFVYDSWQLDVYREGHSMYELNPYSEHHFLNTPRHRPEDEFPKKFETATTDFRLLKVFNSAQHYGPTVYVLSHKRNLK